MMVCFCFILMEGLYTKNGGGAMGRHSCRPQRKSLSKASELL